MLTLLLSVFLHTLQQGPDISRLIGKDFDAGKDWRQKETMVAEDKIVR